MPGGHLSMLGGGASLYVPTEPPPDPEETTSWTSPLQHSAPSGWESYTEIIVEPATGVSKTSDIATWGVKTISLSAGQNRKIVMPMPGDFYGNTTCRRGKLIVNGGGNIVFCVRRADGTYRRGGFTIEMPKYSPYLATSSAAPPPKDRKALDLGGTGTTSRIIDIVGMYTMGVDLTDAIMMNATKARLQLQRCRLHAGRYRCAADRAGNNGNTKDGYSTSSSNPYRLGNENAHPDCLQCYTGGYEAILIHDCTFQSALGTLTFINNTDYNNVAIEQGEIYMSRFNVEPFYFSTPETLNNFNSGYNNQGKNQGTRWYWAVSPDGKTVAYPKRVWVDDDVYFGRNEAWDPGNGDPAWPGRSMRTMQIPTDGTQFTVYDSVSDSPRRVECNLNSAVDSQLCMRRWTRTPGAGTAGTQYSTKAKFLIGDPPGGSYAPASMWGVDGLSYTE